MIPQALTTILDDCRLHPVLVDVGAAGAPPSIWTAIAHRAIYVGFDIEDSSITANQYYKSYRVPRLLDAEATTTTTTFYQTRSLPCSSTLCPDAAALAHYAFADLFEIAQEQTVHVSTLAKELDRLGLDRIDWLKLDTQGLDLRLFQTLPAAMRAGVLALDVEPGLIDAYQGEDKFVDVHRALTETGFWLSNMEVHGTARIHQHTRLALSKQYPGLTAAALDRVIRPSPGWCNARYLRTLEWLQQHDQPAQDFVLLWAFAVLDSQWGYALDIARVYEQRFGPGRLPTLMAEAVLHQLHSSLRTVSGRPFLQPVRDLYRRLAGRCRRLTAKLATSQ